MELRLRMLKECLLEDSNSCSSNGFISMPRRLPLDPFPKRKQSNALQAMINAVKNLRVNKSSSSQRRFSRKNKAENQASITVIRVKDIVRWSSSKDLHFELSPIHQYTTKTTITTTGSSTTSWSDSDFASECSGENSLRCVGEDSCTADTEVGPEDLQCENEQNSPVSVFEIRHEEDDEAASDSSFSQCFDNVERTKEKLMQTIQLFENLANISPFNLEEWDSVDGESCREGVQEIVDHIELEDEDVDEVEEKATQLWNRAKERHCIWIHEEQVIMDYFRDEMMLRTNSFHRDQHFEDQLVREAKGWLHGQIEAELERGTSEERRHACVREFERRDWNERRMKEEQEEVVVQIEDGLFDLLMNETLNVLIPFT